LFGTVMHDRNHIKVGNICHQIKMLFYMKNIYLCRRVPIEISGATLE
jgi:hypothetical protein